MTYDFAEINGTTLHYQALGAGPALILIHAGIAHLEMWEDQIDVLAKQYTVIRYDVRGFGKSPHAPGVYSDHEDLHGLLQHLAIEQTAILGISNGGRIALDFTLAYPDSVTALILVGATPQGYQYVHITDEIERKDAAIDQAYEEGEIALAAELETQFWVDGFKRTPDQVDPAVRAKALEMNTYTLGLPPPPDERQPLEPIAITRLSEIKSPTLVIVGDYDLPDMIASANQLAMGITGTKLVVMPGVAHLPNMERPAEFNRLVLNFLANVS